MEYNLTRWPALDWDAWKETAETLHMYLQIVGKTRLALTPVQNHWWNVPLYLTARGLWTSPMPYGSGETLDIEFDFIDHLVLFRTSTGLIERFELGPIPVQAFYRRYLEVLSSLDVQVALNPMPVEIPEPIPFGQDDQHEAYAPEAVTRFWHALRLADVVLKEFSTFFYGKISPVHFFWGSMDLAVTRFNGRRAPARTDGDSVQAEAYSHEVISAGFWPGNGGYGKAAFYAYAAPVPAALSRSQITLPGRYDPALKEFLLDYSDIAQSPTPSGTLMSFLEETYRAAADAANWDRADLDRKEPYQPASREKNR